MTKHPSSATGKKNIFNRGLSFLQPLTPAVLFYLACLFIFTSFRFILCVEHLSRLREVEQYYLLFPIGFRIDTMLLCRVLILPLIGLILLPPKTVRKFCLAFSLYFSVIASLFVFLEIATFPFMAEFDTRLDRIFLDHLAQTQEVTTMILKGFRLSLAAGVLTTALTGWLVFKASQKLFTRPMVCSVQKRILLALAAGILVYCGYRGTFIHGKKETKLTAFSNSNIANQLALNSTSSLSFAYYNMKNYEQNPTEVYGDMDPREILVRVRKESHIPEEACTNPDIPLLHYQKSNFPAQQPMNLVIILEESLGAEYVGCLGGLPLTPNIDRLSKEGLLLTNLYSTGTRTTRGIEAVISGFPPTPGQSTVMLDLSQTNFFTIAELLGRRGYSTEFLYGGRKSFDHMSAFFIGNGVQRIYDKESFDKNIFEATWGVADEDVFNKALEVFKGHGTSPFFSLILTTSNHSPFDFPDGRIELYEKPQKTQNNGAKYADYALGEFFKTAKKEPYYKNTLFLIIADHSSRLHGLDLIPVEKFHIPGLLIGPSVKPGVYTRVASQIDMTPTLLDLMGISAEHPCPGRSLLSLPDNLPGRAILQYGGINAFMEGNRVIILRPDIQPAQFTYENERLIPSTIDPDFAKTALAHALLPGYLYYNRFHHLPAETGDPNRHGIFRAE